VRSVLGMSVLRNGEGRNEHCRRAMGIVYISAAVAPVHMCTDYRYSSCSTTSSSTCTYRYAGNRSSASMRVPIRIKASLTFRPSCHLNFYYMSIEGLETPCSFTRAHGPRNRYRYLYTWPATASPPRDESPHPGGWPRLQQACYHHLSEVCKAMALEPC